MTRSLMVYVAGPLGTPDRWHDTVPAAVIAGDRLMSHDEIVAYVPHSMGATWSRYCEHDYEWWIAHCLAVVAKCDAVLRIPGESPGADREVDLARRLRIPVFETHAGVFAWADGGGA